MGFIAVLVVKGEGKRVITDIANIVIVILTITPLLTWLLF